MCSDSDQSERKKTHPDASEADANHISNSIMDSSSPNKKTIDSKEEKWKLLLGEACHDMLAGSVLGPNPAVAGLGLSTPRQPAGKARLVSLLRAASLPASSPMHTLCAAHSPQDGRDEKVWDKPGDGLGKDRLQK